MTEPRKPEHQRDKARLNAALFFMHAVGAINKLNPERAYGLFAVEMKYYPKSTAHKDKQASLWRHVERKKLLYATKYPRKLSVKKH
ncbi:MAG: hypothetical protein ACRES4_02410 [Nevskiales bacterium]